MDEQVSNSNSDSDSSETWTFIDNVLVHNENDTDTDGSIAVISEDENEVTTTTPENPIANESDLSDGTVTNDRMRSSSAFSDFSIPKCKDDEMETNSTCTIRESEQELSDEFFLSDFKIKSYVHRKNDRVSSMLNAVLLSTVMVTTVLAIGHMWGTTDDCSLSAVNSVSRILSNMQKLQQENDMLKSKIMLLQSNHNQRPSVDPSVFLNSENLYENAEKRTENYFQNNIKQVRKRKLNDFDSYKFDSSFESTYPSVKSFNINDRLSSGVENQTSDEILETQRSVFNSKVSRTDKEKNSKLSKRFKKKHDKVDCSKIPMDNEVSSFGPKTYCESVINKKLQKRQRKVLLNFNSQKDNKRKEKEEKKVDAVDSDNISPVKKQKLDIKIKDGELKKSEKKRSKDVKSKKDYSKNGNNSEKIKRESLKLNDVDSDWYYKMSTAREEFRKWNQHDEMNNRKRKDKSNWYLRRMRDRESTRFNSDV